MRKFTLIFVFFSSFLSAQRKDSIAGNTLDIYFGYKNYFNDFNKKFNHTGSFNPSLPVQVIGIGISGPFNVNRGANFDGHFIYSQVIPSTITINDTLKVKINGFNFSFAYGKAIIKRRFFTPIIYIGFNTGRLRLNGDSDIKEKNPYFCPKVGFQPKIFFGRLVLSLIIEADWDISRKSWRRTNFSKENQLKINNFNQSCIMTLLSVGYNFFD